MAALDYFGITTGQQLSDHPCSFAFNSSASRSGSFASPNFPGLYPRDTECHFLFFGMARERVHLRFAHFDVEGIRPCSDISASDFVEFSNFYGPDRKYERKCGELKGFEVDSDRKFFRVTFRSNDRLDGTGFNATYQFLDEEDSFTVQKVSRDARGVGVIWWIFVWVVSDTELVSSTDALVVDGGNVVSMMTTMYLRRIISMTYHMYCDLLKV
ncbi:Cubilin homolog [Gryllus bimaculatus]|nr:Cubilin homolog [Gryllus bimaculatus]